MSDRASRMLVIAAPADLLRLRQRRKGVRSLKLEAPNVPPETVLEWQERLAKDYFACGCGAGQAGTAAGVLVVAFYSALFWERVAARPALSVLLALGLLAAFAFTARGLSLLQARLRLSRSIDAVIKEWTHQSTS